MASGKKDIYKLMKFDEKTAAELVGHPLDELKYYLEFLGDAQYYNFNFVYHQSMNISFLIDFCE